jgi:hypothetical protein
MKKRHGLLLQSAFKHAGKKATNTHPGVYISYMTAYLLSVCSKQELYHMALVSKELILSKRIEAYRQQIA